MSTVLSLTDQDLAPAPSGSRDHAGVDLSAGFRALWEAVPIAFLVSVVSGIVFTGIFLTQEPSFETKTVVLVATPSRSEVSAEQLAAQAGTYGGTIADDTVQKEIEEETGQEVSTKGFSANVKVSVASVESAGTLHISTRADSPENSRKLAEAVVGQLAKRAEQVRESDLGSVQASYQEQIERIEGQIDYALARNPEAETFELSTRLDNLRTESEALALNHVSVTQMSQTSEDEESMSTRPFSAGIVAGIVAGLIALALTAIVKLRNVKKVNKVWLHRIAARPHVWVEKADENPHRLPPVTEALVAQAQQSNKRVIVLAGPGRELERETINLARNWWDDADLHDACLGVIDIDRATEVVEKVEKNLDIFASLGIPVRVTVHSQGSKKNK